MSDRQSQNLKPYLKPIRAQPKKLARAAMRQWANRGGHIARVHEGVAAAYTAEQYVEDQDKGYVVAPLRRGCPRHRPTDECPVCSYPAYYRTTVRFDGQPPVDICVECAWSIWDYGRRQFRREEGDDEPVVARHRVDLKRESDEVAKREWAELVGVAGMPHASVDYHGMRVLLANVRRCVAAYALAA